MSSTKSRFCCLVTMKYFLLLDHWIKLYSISIEPHPCLKETWLSNLTSFSSANFWQTMWELCSSQPTIGGNPLLFFFLIQHLIIDHTIQLHQLIVYAFNFLIFLVNLSSSLNFLKFITEHESPILTAVITLQLFTSSLSYTGREHHTSSVYSSIISMPWSKQLSMLFIAIIIFPLSMNLFIFSMLLTNMSNTITSETVFLFKKMLISKMAGISTCSSSNLWIVHIECPWKILLQILKKAFPNINALLTEQLLLNFFSLVTPTISLFFKCYVNLQNCFPNLSQFSF